MRLQSTPYSDYGWLFVGFFFVNAKVCVWEARQKKTTSVACSLLFSCHTTTIKHPSPTITNHARPATHQQTNPRCPSSNTTLQSSDSTQSHPPPPYSNKQTNTPSSTFPTNCSALHSRPRHPTLTTRPSSPTFRPLPTDNRHPTRRQLSLLVTLVDPTN